MACPIFNLYPPNSGPSAAQAPSRHRKTEDDIQPSPAPFIISFFTALLTTIILAALIRSLGIDTLGGGLLLGAITGVGFIATAMASDSAFCGWGMPLFLIQSGYRVLYTILMGGILAAWS